MPKEKTSASVKLRSFVKEFGEEYFCTDGLVLFCKLCEVKVVAEKRFNVQQHCNTAKHSSNVKRQHIDKKRQQLIFDKAVAPSTMDRSSVFSKELCEMMVSANIPLNKVDNPHFKNFLEKYTKKSVPTESTLRKNYLSRCYEDTLNRIRHSVADNKIWISIDETMDAAGRYIGNVIIGTLHADQPGNIFLLTSEVLERTNHSSIAILFDNALKILWKDEIKRENVLLFVTDAAPYMVKAAEALKMFYPKMIHLTCLAHGLHRVAEEIRQNFPEVDKLISNVKKIFLKAPSRVATFKELAPLTPLPPQPVITRWGTWLDAAVYYCENYSIIKNIVNGFNKDDASSIKIAQELFSNSLSESLAYIKSNFGIISSAITRLEAASLEIHESIEIVRSVERSVQQSHGIVGDSVKRKLQNVLNRNGGFRLVCKINDVLRGEGMSTLQDECTFDSSDLTLFKFAPITSCDVERSFSFYKNVLSDHRRSFKPDALKMNLVVHFNSTRGAE